MDTRIQMMLGIPEVFLSCFFSWWLINFLVESLGMQLLMHGKHMPVGLTFLVMWW